MLGGGLGARRGGLVPVPGASHFNVIRGSVSSLVETADEIRLGHVECIEARSTDLSTAGREDKANPMPGQAFFYLVEYSNGWNSSYGAEGVGKPRVVGSVGCP